jgi:hypothetical protein
MLLMLSFSSAALQQPPPDKPLPQQTEQATLIENPPSAAIPSSSVGSSVGSSASASEILRLEQTIRANKQQPQVLTIVPWQLPTHQRINETQTWQPVVQNLPSIERSQFLKDLSVVDDILSLPDVADEKNEQP